MAVKKKEVRVRVPEGLIRQFEELNDKLQMFSSLQDFLLFTSRKVVIELITAKREKRVPVEVYPL